MWGTELAGVVDETRTICSRAAREFERTSPLGSRGAKLTNTSAQILLRRFAMDAVSAAAAYRAFGLDESNEEGRAAVTRYLLLRTAIVAVDRLPHLTVSVAVKKLFCDVFRTFGRPIASAERYRPDRHYNARGLCAFALLMRYPAGQLDWEISGLPRSYLLKLRWRDVPRTMGAVVRDLRGLAPCFMAHMGLCRYSLLFLEEESNRSFYRMAKSMELQPSIRGLLAASWFHSPETHRVSPHLSWTNRTPTENGAVVASIGPAPPDAGFLVGSPQRRRLYETGAYRPTTALVIWPRKHLLAWAAAHPEFEQ